MVEVWCFSGLGVPHHLAESGTVIGVYMYGISVPHIMEHVFLCRNLPPLWRCHSKNSSNTEEKVLFMPYTSASGGHSSTTSGVHVTCDAISPMQSLISLCLRMISPPFLQPRAC